MKTIEMPKMGDTMEEGKILRWLKQEGDPIKKGEFVAEVETEKVNIEIEAFTSGVLRKILIPAGKSAPVGADIALVGAADEPLPAGMNGPARGNVATVPNADVGIAQTSTATPNSANSPTSVVNTTTAMQQGRTFISPIARRLAQEHNLDYRSIQGTGPNGRIIRMDIEAVLAAQKQPVPVAPVPTYVEPAPEPVAAVTTSEEVEIPLTSMRRAIARRLSQSMQTAPHFYMTSVIDTDKLAALRQQINEYAAKDPSPVKVSFNDLIVKAVARALLRIPQMNVSFAEDRILQKRQVHIGVAVALEQGLIVPVVHSADQRSILEIARETQHLAEAARTGKLRPEELSGGTFTVSNLGMFDVESFTAIINPPESAILAIGAIIPTPAVVDGQIVVRDRIKVTLSSDHRAIDGAIAARFLQEVKRLLEEPLGLLI